MSIFGENKNYIHIEKTKKQNTKSLYKKILINKTNFDTIQKNKINGDKNV